MADRTQLLTGLSDNTTGDIEPINIRNIVNNDVLPEDLVAGTNITLDKGSLPAITITSDLGMDNPATADLDMAGYNLTDVGNITGTDTDLSLGTGDVTTSGTLGAGAITGTSLTDGTATLSGGDLTSMGNITGADTDLSLGTGDITTSGTLGAGAITGTSLTDGTATLTGGNLTAMGNITGTDVDLELGTGDINTTGTIGSGDITVGLVNSNLVDVEAVTGANGLTASESLKLITNEGATGESNNTLPTAAAGLMFVFYCQDTDGIKATANTSDTIRLGPSVSISAGYASSSTIGSSLTLVAINATEWVATSIVGTWLLETS